MQTKLNKLALSLSVIILAGCQGSTQSNSTTPTNQALTLNEYVSMLDYIPNNDTVSRANATIQAGSTYQQSFTASESVTLSSVDVMFYDGSNCTGNALSNITMNASNPMAPTTMPAGTYRSTNTSNLALANRFQPTDSEGGANAEFNATKSLKFVYHYSEAPGISEMCLANSNNSNQERISNMGADTYCTTGSSCGFSKAYNINLQFEVAGDGVRGWPSYVAQGGVLMDYTYYDPSQSVAEYNQRPVDAIFTYDNGEGSAALEAPTITLAAIKGAQGITTNNGTYTRPVIVHYTLNQSEGLDAAPLAESEMAKHFTKLIYNIQTMEHFYNASTNPYPGSFVMNPDTLGEIQKDNGTAIGHPFAGTFQVNKALHTAVCATGNEFAWENVPYAAGGGTYNGTGTAIDIFFNMLTSAPWQDSGVQTWTANFQPVVYNNCNSTTPITSGIEIPTFTNDFKGWIQATNWIFKQFGPHTTFGWQENMWVIGAGGPWVHDYSLTNNQIDTEYGLPVADWLNAEEVFNGTYRPDFIVFDKYERDAYDMGNETFGKGWLWGVGEFENYLRYVKYVTANVGTDQSGKPYYAMLWQIPGGHLQYATGEDGLNVQHASTEPDIIFGDTNLTEDFANVKTTLMGTAGGNYSSLSSFYSLTPYVGLPASTLLLRSPYTEWHVNRMDQLASARVFSVLWGGGNTTSVGTKPWNDPWLSQKLINYYQHTTPVK